MRFGKMLLRVLLLLLLLPIVVIEDLPLALRGQEEKRREGRVI